MLSKDTIAQLQEASLPDGLSLLAKLYPGEIAFSCSLGQEDQVITDAICRQQLNIRIFTLDTGRLFSETYELIERTTARYKRKMEIYFPAPEDVEPFVKENGINSFYESVENRKACCHIRKVKPLNRALAGAKIWITGLRAGQSDNRKDMPVIEWDEVRQLYKYNPLISWTGEEVNEYIHQHHVPYNPLHDKGFLSIGCAPCTRAVEPGEDERAGRWWWEQSQKECGLHQS
ncbi:MAG: phosphoadenylyl-sulfate reductase [Bacteroidetes bacterium]|nr:phosphoadenylyl-sulfate reductase [Bacteroidota bacterium]